MIDNALDDELRESLEAIDKLDGFLGSVVHTPLGFEALDEAFWVLRSLHPSDEPVPPTELRNWLDSVGARSLLFADWLPFFKAMDGAFIVQVRKSKEESVNDGE